MCIAIPKSVWDARSGEVAALFAAGRERDAIDLIYRIDDSVSWDAWREASRNGEEMLRDTSEIRRSITARLAHEEQQREGSLALSV